MRRIIHLILFVSVGLFCGSIVIPEKYNDNYGIYSENEALTEQVKAMSIDEKIGQIFMIPVYSERSSFHKKEILELIERKHIGGVIFMQGHPYKQYKWTKEFNKLAKVPLLVAMDAEWGLSMRLDSVIKYPKNMTLGALTDNTLIRTFSARVAQQMQYLGVNVSFGPVVDINSNANNPVIHMRSFGESKYDVADKGIQYMLGLQDNGVLAVAKHFPGHGDTYLDSHLELPTIEHSKRRINRVELYPFERIFSSGIGGAMTAHLNIPAYMGEDGGPASLSKKITSRLLKRGLGFEGLVFSDALNMKAVTKYVPQEEIDLAAFEAGNDVLLFPANIDHAIQSIKEAINTGRISEKDLDNKVIRILMAKEWMAEQRIEQDSTYSASALYDSLNNPSHILVNEQIAEECGTLLGKSKLERFKNLHDTLLLISFGKKKETVFAETLKKYSPVKTLFVEDIDAAFTEERFLQTISQFEKVIVSLHNVNPYKVSSNFGYEEHSINLLNKLCKLYPDVLLVNFGTPYMLNKFDFKNPILQYYEEYIPAIQEAAAEAIYGANGLKGIMPVSTTRFDFGEGEKTQPKNLLKYGLPEQEGLSSTNLSRIDLIAENAIKEGATPGCQILVAKNGRVVYQKAFGHFDYDSTVSISNEKIYDVASITKVMASTLLLMRFYEMGEIDLDKTLYDYLGGKVDSTKMDLTLREILAHQAGLSAWIPFYKYTLNEAGICDSNYCYSPNTFFNLRVADSLFVQNGIKDTIYKMINSSKMKTRGKYLYSDLGYYYMLQILEDLNNGPVEDYLYANFYNSMGMNHTLYNPLNKYDKVDIVPTENDKYFRKQLVHGYVHDPGAAMMGGVAGHAGIFSNANDVAKLFQMFLQKGSYNGINYLEPETVEHFTKRQFDGNRKGVGFDKPETREGVPGPLIKDVSPKTFGHTGFTGTCVWADPEYHLVFVFLSNRINPTAENLKLIRMNVRTDILQVVYDDLLDKVP